MTSAKFRCTAIASILLTLNGCSTQPARTGLSQNPLVIAACPDLPPIPQHTFGDTVSALTDLYGTYYACQSAALAGQKPPPPK